MKYEYISVQSVEPKHFSSMLTAKGSEGWRVVQIIHHSSTQQSWSWVAIMERELKAQS
jgi:hypothetical protein